MKLIENKKLFGKVNMLDILLLIIVIILAFFVYKYFIGNKAVITGTNYGNKRVEVRLENVPFNLFDKIKEGDLIYDNETNVYVGKLISAERKEYTMLTQDYENNEFRMIPSENSENVILNIEVSVNDITSDLITETNYNIKVGKIVALRGPSYAGSGYIINIER